MQIDDMKSSEELEKEYRGSISGWDWTKIKADCGSEMEPDPDDESQLIGYCYLGSCLVLTPSGKFYLPFACSNVDLCPSCKGAGCDMCGHLGSYEAHQDEVWRKILEEIAESHGLFITGSDGDGCDIMAAIVKEK